MRGFATGMRGVGQAAPLYRFPAPVPGAAEQGPWTTPNQPPLPGERLEAPTGGAVAPQAAGALGAVSTEKWWWVWPAAIVVGSLLGYELLYRRALKKRRKAK